MKKLVIFTCCLFFATGVGINFLLDKISAEKEAAAMLSAAVETTQKEPGLKTADALLYEKLVNLTVRQIANKQGDKINIDFYPAISCREIGANQSVFLLVFYGDTLVECIEKIMIMEPKRFNKKVIYTAYLVFEYIRNDTYPERSMQDVPC